MHCICLIVIPVPPHLGDPLRVGPDLGLVLQLACDVVQLRNARESRKPQDGPVGELFPLLLNVRVPKWHGETANPLCNQGSCVKNFVSEPNLA